MKIVGICLVQNDDRFLDTVLHNVYEFCDELIIADHHSKDRTSEIANEWANKHNHIRYHRIAHPSESQDLIAPYYGEDVWLFAVDGDEIYEPDRLAGFKLQLQQGRFSDKWQVLGKVLHCDGFDSESKKAEGYLARPSRSMTKLYNFSVISDWKGPHSERLHGGDVVFIDPKHKDAKDHGESELPWDDAVFRCLHMVFLRRSSLQTEHDVSRPNIAEKNAFSLLGKIKYRLMQCFGKEPESQTKHLTYMRGNRVDLDVASFFSEDHKEY